MVAAMNAGNPLAEASPQEALAIFWRRPCFAVLEWPVLALLAARPGDDTQVVQPAKPRHPWAASGWIPCCLTVLQPSFSAKVPLSLCLKMNGNLRFFLALLVERALALGLGVDRRGQPDPPAVFRPFYIVLLTLGLGYVLRETIQLLWDPVAYAMERPRCFPNRAKPKTCWPGSAATTSPSISWALLFPVTACSSLCWAC